MATAAGGGGDPDLHLDTRGFAPCPDHTARGQAEACVKRHPCKQATQAGKQGQLPWEVTLGLLNEHRAGGQNTSADNASFNDEVILLFLVISFHVFNFIIPFLRTVDRGPAARAPRCGVFCLFYNDGRLPLFYTD